MVDIGSLWSTKDGPIIRYVGSMDGATEYRVVSQTEFVQKTRLRGNKQKYTYYRDGKLFIETPVECVRIEYYEPFNMGACTYLDQELKVPNNIQDELFRLAFQNLSVYLSKPMDMTDNKNSNQ